MQPLGMTGNFTTKHEIGDFYFNLQKAMGNRIGNLGTQSDKFKDRAYKQFNEDRKTWEKFAKIQDGFKDDALNNTPGRDGKNYNRMEYDFEEKHAKHHDNVMDELKKQKNINVKDLLTQWEQKGYTLCSTASAIGDKPIIEDDYKEQINLK